MWSRPPWPQQGEIVSSSPSHRGGVPVWAVDRRSPQCLATTDDLCSSEGRGSPPAVFHGVGDNKVTFDHRRDNSSP